MTCPPHFFLLPTPKKNQTPIGVCKVCGYRKLHSNFIEVTFWKNKQGVRPKQGKKSGR